MRYLPNRGWSGRLRRFRRDEAGGATVEACLWLPFFFAFFILVLDATFVFARQSDAHRIVQDGTRQYITGGIDTTADLETWLETAMQPIAPSAVATVTIDTTKDLLTARISYSAEDTDLTGATGVLGGLTIRVQSVQLIEE